MGFVRFEIGSVGDLEAIVRALLGGRRRWSKTRLEELIARLKSIEVSVVSWAALGEALGELRERTAVARLRWTLAEIARRAGRSREHLSRLFNRAVVRLTAETTIKWGLAIGMPLWVSVPESLAASCAATAGRAQEESGGTPMAEAVAGQVTAGAGTRGAAAEAEARVSKRKDAGGPSERVVGPVAGTMARDVAAEAGVRASRRKDAGGSSERAAEEVTEPARTRGAREEAAGSMDVGRSTEAVAVQVTAGAEARDVAAEAEARASKRKDAGGSSERAAGQVTPAMGARGAAAGQVTATAGARAIEGGSAAEHVTPDEGVTEVDEVAAAGHVTAEREPVAPGDRVSDDGGEAPSVECDSESGVRREGVSSEVTDGPRQVTDRSPGQITARKAARGDVTADLTSASIEK
ncbi:MAG TPA: hypothetical protein PKW35_18025, partial [Nannocystaceae bacterium]|nr:hypothetical protein [Nannocystaceae bacterium]